MSVNKNEAKIFSIALNNLLYMVSTFSDKFAELIAKLKSQLVIIDIFLYLAWAHLQVYKYDSDLKVKLLLSQSIPSSCASPLFNTQACVEFVEIAVKNKAKYEEAAQAKKSEIIKYCAWKVIDLLYYMEFSSLRLKLDRIRVLALNSDVTNTVKLRYKRFSIYAKTKFYVD